MKVKQLIKEGQKQIKAAFKQKIISDFDLEDELSTNLKAYRHSDYNKITYLCIVEHNHYKEGVKFFVVCVKLAFGHYFVAKIYPEHCEISFFNYPKTMKGIVKDDQDLAKAVLSYFYKKGYKNYEISFEKTYALDETDFWEQQKNAAKNDRSILKEEKEEQCEKELSDCLFKNFNDGDSYGWFAGIDIQNIDKIYDSFFVLLTFWFSPDAYADLKYEEATGKVVVERVSGAQDREVENLLKKGIPVIENFFKGYNFKS